MAGRDRAGAAQRGGAVGRGAQSDEQHALDAAVTAGEMQRLVARAAEVAPRERAAQRAAGHGVDRRQLAGQLGARRRARRRAAAFEPGEIGRGGVQRKRHEVGTGAVAAVATSQAFIPLMI